MARDISILFKVVDQVTAPVREINNRVKGFVDGVQGWFKGMTAGLVALGVGAFFKSAVEEAAEYEEEIGRLDVALRNAGSSWGEVGSRVKDATAAIERHTKFSGGEATNALTKLVTATGDVEKSLGDLGLVADIAAYKKIGMVEAADLLTKAEQGNAKAFKEFGIEAGTNAEKLDQLKAKVDGFGEQSGTGIMGWFARVKNGWDNFKESVGLALTQSDALDPVVDGLVGTLANLAGWVEENAHHIEGFVTGLITIAGVIKDVVVGAFGLFNDGITASARLWLELMTAHERARLAIVAGFGSLLQAIGEFLTAGKDVLRKFGIDVGEGVAETMARAGARMNAQAKADLTVVNATYAEKRQQLVGTVTTGEAAVTAAVKTGGGQRTKLTEAELKELDRQRKASAKALEELEKVATKSSLELLSAQHKEYQGAVELFQQKMQSMTAADRAKAEELLKKHLDNLLLKWAGFDASMDQRVPKIKDATEHIELQASSLEDLGQKIDQYVLATEGASTAELTAQASRETVRAQVKEVADAYALAADEMGVFLDILGASTPQTDAFVAGIGNISDAIGKIAIGDTLGGIQSGLAGIASFAQIAFGQESASARFVRLALEKTRDKLEQHQRTLGDLIEISRPGRQLAGVEAALGAIDFSKFSDKDFARNANDKALNQVLGRFLLDRGLTMADLDSIAAAFGVEIRDDKGRLNAQLLDGLFHLLQSSEVGFANTLEGQLDRIQQGVRVGTITDEVGALVDVIKDPKLGIPAIAAALDAAGSAPASRVAALQDLFELLGTPGAISKDSLGGASEAQFRAILQQLIELLVADLPSAEDDGGSSSATPTPAEPEPAPPVGESVLPDAVVAAAIADPELLDRLLDPLHEIAAGVTELVALGTEMRANRSGAGLIIERVELLPGAIQVMQATGTAEETVDVLSREVARKIRLDLGDELQFFRDTLGSRTL